MSDETPLHPLNYRAFAGSGDSQALGDLVAGDFLWTNTDGEWLGRARFLRDARRSRRLGNVLDQDQKLSLYGTFAVHQGLYETSIEGSKDISVRYTDVYHWNGRWRLINVQETVLQEGVSPQQRSLVGAKGEARRTERHGETGSTERQILRNLNKNYVRAFRECDVSWYESHLSEDYTVVNSDGSFDDRSQALSEFARPVFATHIQSFPVHKTRIRLFGDLALIHAQNAYTLKDGRRGINRYTDLWHREATGSWSCISAHITTHRKAT